MKGSQHFIYVANRQMTLNNDASSVSNDPVATCWNCSKPSGDGEKCPHCHIKLKKKEVLKPVAVQRKTTGSKPIEEEAPQPSMENVPVKRASKK